jgi:hypothetical protein
MEAATYAVPHCSYSKTPEGFVISFRRMPLVLKSTIVQTMNNQNRIGTGKNSPGVAFVLGQALNLIIKLVVALVYWIWLLFFPTKIVIKKNAVVVAGKEIQRSEFKGFTTVGRRQALDTTGRSSESMVNLGYLRGHETVKFGGTWKEYQADDVIRALNAHLEMPA